jgi:hypothetical protein
MDPNLLLQALTSHAWPAVVGACLVLVVYLARLPGVQPQWQRLPAAYRPLVPVLLGVVSGVAEALSTRQPWLPALVGGVVSALPALAVALPSPTAHLGQIMLPDSPVTQAIKAASDVRIVPAPVEGDLADQVLAALDRDTEPQAPKGP